MTITVTSDNQISSNPTFAIGNWAADLRHGLPTAERFSGVLGMFSSSEVKVLYPT